MVLERLYLQDMQKISGDVEQKICAVGVTNILTEAPAMLHSYEAFWWVAFSIQTDLDVILRLFILYFSMQRTICKGMITKICHSN